MIKQLFMRWLWCLQEYLMVFPFVIIVSGFTINQDAVLPFALLIPVHLLIGIIITCMLKKMNNLLIAGIALAYTVGVTFIWQLTIMGGSFQEIIFTAVITAVFFMWGVKSGTGYTRFDFYYFLGLVIYGVSIFVISRAPTLKSFLNITVGAAIIYVIAGLPLTNRRFLIQETRQKSSLKIIPGTVVRGNRIILAFITIIMVLLSFWDKLLNAIAAFVQAVVGIIIKVFNWLTSLFMGESSPNGGGTEDLGLPPADDSSSNIINIILTVITVAVLLIIAYAFIRKIIINHKRIYAAIQAFLSRLFSRFQRWSSTEQGYSDRQESLLKTDFKKRPSLLKRIFSRKPTWKDMKDNASRVRFIYTRFVSDNIKKGLNFSPSDTPDETVKRIHSMEKDSSISHEKIRTEYNKVRYGEKAPTDDTVNELKQKYIK
ncbi:MAG: hypothetical protein PHC69_10205 [Ruminiclostridium sp.]|nr:hypothetical protein [Ruminiclostridium sp.]